MAVAITGSCGRLAENSMDFLAVDGCPRAGL